MTAYLDGASTAASREGQVAVSHIGEFAEHVVRLTEPASWWTTLGTVWSVLGTFLRGAQY